MLDFALILLATAGSQILGGVISWFFVKKFLGSLRIIVAAEMLLMLLVSSLLVMEGLKVTLFSMAGVFLGMAALFALNNTVPHKHQKTNAERIGLLVFIAICFHELPEGIAFGSSYLVDPGIGLAAAFFIAIHNISEGSIISIPYFLKGRFMSGLKAVLATQVLYVIGGLLAYYALISFSQQLRALAMAVSAGAMLYIIGEEFLWMRSLRG
jgi:ZIP family zinc transporter